MRYPVKINRGYWPAFLCKRLPTANDVLQLISKANDASAFSNGVCAIKIDGVFKTTKSARYPEMISAIQNLTFNEPPVILDVAASDGSAALSTLQSVAFKHYYITDQNPVIYWAKKDEAHFFYKPNGACFMAATNKLVYYADTIGAFPPLKSIAEKLFRKADPFNKDDCHELILINPAIDSTSDRISVIKHDLFEQWTGETPTLIIAANILNDVYFDEARLQKAILCLVDSLKGQGYLAVVDNRPDEHGSLFSVIGHETTLIQSINGGAMTESLVLATVNK